MSGKKAEIRKRLAELVQEAADFGVYLDVNERVFIDDAHLDCFWYGGMIGKIYYPNGWAIVIEVNGDVRLHGKKGGKSFDYVNKNNSGAIGEEISGIIRNDKELETLTKTPRGERNGSWAEYGNNNWVEYNYLTPGGEFVDLGMWMDNVLEDNVLEAFSGVAELGAELWAYVKQQDGEPQKKEESDNGHEIAATVLESMLSEAARVFSAEERAALGAAIDALRHPLNAFIEEEAPYRLNVLLSSDLIGPFPEGKVPDELVDEVTKALQKDTGVLVDGDGLDDFITARVTEFAARRYKSSKTYAEKKKTEQVKNDVN